MLKKFVHTFGALKMAIAIMLAIATIMVAGTFFGLDLATGALRKDLYRSWWFNGLLVLMAVNIVCATFKRDPFHVYQVPFVITHGGLLLILFGAMLSNLFKIYGTVTIVEEQSSNIVQIEDEREIRVSVKQGQAARRELVIDDDFGMYEDSIPNRVVPIESTGYFVRIKEFRQNAEIVPVTTEGGTEDHPAVQVQFHMGGQLQGESFLFAHPRVSGETSRTAFGPLRLYFKQATADEVQKEADQYGVQSGGRYGSIHFHIGADSRTVDVEQNINKEFELGPNRITLKNYFPDFQKHASVGDGAEDDPPQDPAVEFSVKGPEGEKRYLTFARDESGTPIDLLTRKEGDFHSRYSAPQPSLESSFRIYATEKGLKYLMTSAKGRKAAGDLTLQQPVDFAFMPMEQKPRVTVTKWIPSAVTRLEAKAVPVVESQSRAPAIYAEILFNGKTEGQWLPYVPDWGDELEAAQFFGGAVSVSYTSRVFPLDFKLHLKHFFVPKNPGTADASLYESRVMVVDGPKHFEENIGVTYPLHYRGFIFYQTSYNRIGDRYVSFLSASKDPGLRVVYAGFIFLGAGILGMFYVRPFLMKRYRTRKKSA